MADFTFHKASLVAAGLCMSLGAFAADYVTSPAVGVINMEAFPGGINSINILGDYSINRDADAFISLWRGNEVLSRIPASSVTDLKCTAGFQIVDHGQFEAYFFGMNGPGSLGGEYTVKVDAGLFSDYATGTPNEAVEFHYTVPYKTQEFIVGMEPASGVITSLKDFTLTLREGAVASGAYFSLLKTGAAEVEYSLSCEIKDNVIKISAPEEITEKGSYTLSLNGLTVKYGEQTVSYNGATMGALNWAYTIMDITGIPAITPVPGTYMGFESFTDDCMVSGSVQKKNIFFTLNFEEDLQMLLMGRPYWVRLNEDGTEDASTKLLLAVYGGVDMSSGTAAMARRYVYVGAPTNDMTQLISAPGKYRLVIPKGCYQLQGVGQNPATSFEYEIIQNDQFQYRLSPADGSKMKSLEYVTVTFDEGMNIEMSPSAYATITDGVTRYTLHGTLTEGLTNEVTFFLSHPITDNGTWQFISPSTGLSVNGISPVVTATYFVDSKFVADEHPYTITPTPGTDLDKLTSFVLEYEGYNNIGYNGIGSPVLTNGTETYALNCWSLYPDSPGFMMELNEPITTPGQYYLSIPANALQVMCFDANMELVPGTEVFTNDTIYEAFNVVAAKIEVACEVTPADGASFDDTNDKSNVLSEIVVEFPEAVSVQAMMVSAVITDGAEGEQVLKCTVEGNKAVFPIEKDLTTGDWTFTVNANAFYVSYADEKAGTSPEISATYKVVRVNLPDDPDHSGVAGVEAADGNVTVYNVSGVCLLKNAPAEALTSLEPGFYIVNGKKVVLTK